MTLWVVPLGALLGAGLEGVEGGLVTADVRIPCVGLQVEENRIYPGLRSPEHLG